MYPGFEYMTALRLTQVIQGLIDIRDINAGLLWVGRTPITPAADGEILGRFTGNVLIADLIAEDSAAAVYSAGKLQFETYTRPKLKMGRSLTESQLSQLDQIRRGEIRGEEAFLNFIGPIATNCLAGIRQRMEFLIVSMLTDTMTYDRLGFKATGATWGMQSDLKVTTANPWDNTATGTPVSDILAVDLIGRVRYGITFNRLTMSTQAFRYMIATTEFQNKAKVYLPPQLTFTNLNLSDLQTFQALAERTVNKTIELYDSRYFVQDTAGNNTSAPYLAINKVIMDNTANDQNAMVRDFSNGIPQETKFLGLPNAAVIGGETLQGGQYGPIAYMTYPPELNSPELTLWGVAKGWPRKPKVQSNAVLTVGAFNDLVPVSEPF
jgi:hypothetical protein